MDDLLRRLVRPLEAHPEVVVGYLFGSTARGTAGPLSDADVAVLLQEDGDQAERQLRLMADLSEAVGARRVDVVVLNAAPVALAYRVLRDGRLLLCRDEKARVRHRAGTVDRYLDMEPFRRALGEGTRHRIDEGRLGRR